MRISTQAILAVSILVALAGCGALEPQSEAGDPLRDSRPVRALAQALAPPSNAFSTSDGQFIEGADNQGWWSATMRGLDTRGNYATGRDLLAGDVRSFLTFDLSTLDLTGRTITSAALQIQSGIAIGDPVETVNLFDVSTDAATLNANDASSAAIFEDLGTGTSYGSHDLQAGAPAGTQAGLLWLPLNAAGIADITNATGGYFSIGAAILNFSGQVQEIAFGYTTNEGVQQLVVCFDTDADSDGDGVCDVADDCADIANPTQADTNGDGIGDACADDDGDGLVNTQDNCPFSGNPQQEDVDGDGFGDVCDNCIEVASETQSDIDRDLVGDACDNCPVETNSDQSDSNGNGAGDACDDSDGDGTADLYDNCPALANPDQSDGDFDSIGDACDAIPQHDLILSRITVANASVRRGETAQHRARLMVENAYDVPERFQVCVYVSSELPAGCAQSQEPACSELVTHGRGRARLELDVPITCASDAARGRFDLTFEGLILHDPTSGYEADGSNNYASTNASLRVR